MTDKEKKAMIERILSANVVYHKNRQYTHSLHQLLPFTTDSSFNLAVGFELERLNNHQRVIKNYIKGELSKLFGIRWFGEVVGSEILEETVTTTPIEYFSLSEVKDGEITLNELVPNKYGTHFVGTKALVLNLSTGKIKEDKDTQKCKIIKIPKVASVE